MLAGTGAAGAAAPAPPPCQPRHVTVAGHPAIRFCGPATVVISAGGHTYRFSGGLCERSATIDGLELEVGTLVRGAHGNGGRSFVSLVIAASPSESEAFEAYSGGRQLFGDSVVAPGGRLISRGTFSGLFGAAFSGSWNCHGVVYDGR